MRGVMIGTFSSASSSTLIKEGYEGETPAVSSVDIVVFPELTVQASVCFLSHFLTCGKWFYTLEVFARGLYTMKAAGFLLLF